MITRRASVTALVAVAVAGLASGCLSSNSGGGSSGGGNRSGPGKGTVEVMYGFGADRRPPSRRTSTSSPRRTGSPSSSPRPRSWDTEIRARVAGGNPPDVGPLPAAGPDVRPGQAEEGPRLRRRRRRDATAQTWSRLRQAGTCADWQGLRPAHRGQRQEPHVVRPGRPSRQPVYRCRRRSTRCSTLTDQLKSQGKTPWCIAAESGQATGWPITDWIEDLVLRLAGPDNYDKWVTGALKFNSPEIKPAFEYFQKIAFTDANVRGGTKSIVATNFQTGGNAHVRQPAGLLPVQAGHVRRRQGWLPGRRDRQPGHRRSA